MTHGQPEPTADEHSARAWGAMTFGAFDPSARTHRDAARLLHDRLVAIGFGPQRGAALFGLREMVEIRPHRSAYYDEFVIPHNAAGRAARFFVLHAVEDDAELRRWLTEPLMIFLAEMGAIVAVDGGWRSIIGLSWFAGRLVATDALAFDVVWPGMHPPPDYVMPPGMDSIGLVRVAPRIRRERVLDLCCGAGAQTLAAADYAEHVLGVDVNPRALRFARFNAAANQVDAAFVLGDLYTPLDSGETFGAIVANPPFVPWPQAGAPALLFRGGGERGDDVIARIVAGAPQRLEPNGTLSIVADFADAPTLPDRLSAWQRRAWRTLILLEQHYDLIAYAESHAGHLRGAEREALVLELMRHFARSGITSLDFGYVVQTARPGPTHTIRTRAALERSIAGEVAASLESQEQPNWTS